MYIEKVTVVDAQKSDETIVFGPIDGGNGTIVIGDQSKSTWLKAISFALGHSNEMVSFSSDTHTFNGFVEITFTILKSLFNDVDSNQQNKHLSIRRSIQANQYEYSIDGLHAERIDVKNLLQTYGFADYYPCQYSIQCNDITSIEMSDATDRVQWLKNCCGVDEYNAKKNKSMRVLRETDDNIRKIDKSLKKIDVQLEIFGTDEKQQIYQRIVNREKELGHFQRQYRVKKIRAEIQQLDAKKKDLLNRIAIVKSDVLQCTNNGIEIRREIKSIGERIHVLKTNVHQLQRDIVEYERVKMELIEEIDNLRNAIEQGAMAEELNTNEKRLYEEKIDHTRTSISMIDTQIDAIEATKEKLEEELTDMERQAEAIVLNCQQNQRIGKQFQSIEQRNEYISGLIRKTKTAISRENRKRNNVLTDLQSKINELKNFESHANKYNQQLNEMNAKEESDSFHRQQEMISSLENQKFDLIDESEKLAEKSQELKSDLEQTYDELRSQIGDSIFEGINSMKSLLQKKLAHGFREQYFGLVIENFTCTDPHMTNSLATLMGEYLFYHIVDSSDTAARIISEFNKVDLPGEVNFFVLDMIEDNGCNAHNSLISRFSFDAKYQKVFERILNEQPLNVQDIWNKSAEEFDCLTSSRFPDVFEKGGALIAMGSAISNFANNSIELYEKQQSLLEQNEATRYEQSENSYRMDATICSIDETNKSLNNRRNTIAKILSIENQLSQIAQRIKTSESHIATVRAELQNIETKKNELTDTKNRYEIDMKSDQLLQEEKMEIERLQVLINGKKMELARINEQAKKVKGRRDNMAQFFDQTLMSRYNAIEASTKEYSDATNELDRKEQEQLQYAENKLNAESDLNAVRRQMADLQQQYESKKARLRELDQLKLDLHQRQNNLFIELSELDILANCLTKELNQLISIKPPDATQIRNPDIIDMSETDVNSQLDIARHQLKTYQNTNCFDINILEKFKRDRANFVRRRAELAKLDAKISTAMTTLDTNIHTAIESTFNDMSMHFAAIFQRFIPNGSARLQAIKDCQQNEPISNADGDGSSSNISTITGIDIFARFPDEIEKQFDDLNGQKRRIVSFAFIVCMQQLYPAPFYLFDCIDELFFGPYLAPFINYLNELSNRTQIIMTSNQQCSLNGLKFIDNVFQSVVTEGTPKIQRIQPQAEEAVQ